MLLCNTTGRQQATQLKVVTKEEITKLVAVKGLKNCFIGCYDGFWIRSCRGGVSEEETSCQKLIWRQYYAKEYSIEDQTRAPLAKFWFYDSCFHWMAGLDLKTMVRWMMSLCYLLLHLVLSMLC